MILQPYHDKVPIDCEINVHMIAQRKIHRAYQIILKKFNDCIAFSSSRQKVGFVLQNNIGYKFVATYSEPGYGNHLP